MNPLDEYIPMVEEMKQMMRGNTETVLEFVENYTGAVIAGRNQKKDTDICAGDEIINDGERCVVLWLGNRLQFPYLLHQDGSVSVWVSAFNALKEKKTGRHFDLNRIWSEIK